MLYFADSDGTIDFLPFLPESEESGNVKGR